MADEAGTAGLQLVLCEGWEGLCAHLADDLARPLDDPFASQLVVVGAPAARRALSQELAVRLGGICAGVEFTGLRSLRRRLEAQLLGIEAGDDPWRSRGLALAVLDVLDEAMAEPWFAPLAHHLGAEATRPGRRLGTADRIARLYLRYARTSPQLLRAWSGGATTGPDEMELPEHEAWQPRVWRLVCERLQVVDPVTRHDELLAAIAAAPALPLGDGVLRLVDPTPCGPLDRELVAALSARMPVRLWQRQVAGDQDAALGAQWGRSEQLGIRRWRELAHEVELVHEATPTSLSGTVLHALQGSLQGTDLAGPAAADGSVQVHASHGPDRQVEVLRELLCTLFDEDPTLEPRDVVVACTDLAGYAPLVRATFCLDEQVLGTGLHPGHRLRVQLADGSLEQRNEVLETLRLVLRLAGDRATAHDLVELCSSAPVATRFGLGPDDLERVRRLVGAADIRWGLDARHRSDFGLSQVRQSTWLAGVERILVGVAMGPQPLRWLGTALPVEQVDGSDVMAAGTLAEVVSRCRKLVAEWRTPTSIGGWTTRLREALELLVATDGDDAWQLTAAHAELADLADLTTSRTAPLRAGDVGALFDRLLRTSGGRPNLANGSLLFCGLDDLAGASRRVVVVLGLDDERFPARPRLDGDDLTGWLAPDDELDERARSRQLLLDALACATERFVVVHQGFAARTNEPLPQPVAVIDLLAACTPHGGALLQRHSLQPQSWANFATTAARGPSSFDRAALQGAQALAAQGRAATQPPVPLWQVPLGAPGEPEVLDVHQLLDFYRHPARELLRRSMGVTMTQYDDELAEELPVEPDPLQEWAIGDRMMRLALEGLEPDAVAAAERLRGELPPGQLGTRTLSKLMPQVGKVVGAARRERALAPRDIDCELALPPGCGAVALTGRIRVHGGSIVSHAFSRTGAVHLLQAWFELLLLAATQPGAPATGWRAVHVGRDAVASLLAPPAETCRELLAQLVAVRTAGLVQLVPLPPKAAAEFSGTTPLRPFANHDPERSARRSFTMEHDADWARFLPPDLDQLRAIPRMEGDPGMAGGSRFENLSDWLFSPLREQMSVSPLREQMGGGNQR